MAELDFDFSGINNLQKKLERLANPEQVEGAIGAVLNRMGAVYVREAKKKTPVGPRSISMFVGHSKKGNPKFKVYRFNTQNMRKSWFVGKPFRKDVNGNTVMSVMVFNTSRYSSYVDDGHRQKVGQFLPFIGAGWQEGRVFGGRLKQSWVPGLNITTQVKNIVESNSANIMRNGFNAWLRSMLRND